MRGEDDVRSFGNLVDLVDEYRALPLKSRDHVDVVNDLLAHVNGSAEPLESFLDSDDCPIYSCTVPTWCGQQHPLCLAAGGLV